MAEISWQAKIELDISDLKKKLQQAENEIQSVVGDERKIELGIDTAKFEKAISNLDKMLDSIGKGSGDFKQFENLSKYLDNVKSDLSDVKKTFGSLNANGMNNIVTSINSIDKSLTSLTEKLQIVKKDASGNIVNTSGIGELGNLFSKIEQHLDSLRKSFGEIGDTDGLKPLINQVNDLKSAMSGLKMNLNLDLGNIGSGQNDTKIAETTKRYVQAYKDLFESIKKSGRATKEMRQFVAPENISDAELVGIYKSMIGRAESKYTTTSIKDGKKVANNNFRNWFSDYYKEINNARDAVTRANKSSTNDLSLENIFGNTNIDISGIVSQLERVSEKLDEIASSAKTMGEAFSSGLNVSASVEEITKLTERVKELENELQKVRSVNTGSGNTENGSGGTKTDNQKAVNDALKEQTSAMSKLQELRVKMAKTDDQGLISMYQQQRKAYLEQCNTAGKILQANKDLYNSQEHINQLKQIALKTDTEIYKIQQSEKEANKNIQSEYNDALKVIQEYESAQNKVNKLKGNGDYSSESFKVAEQRVEALEKAYEAAISTLEKFKAELQNGYDGSSIDKIGVSAKELENNLTHAKEVAGGSLESIAAAMDKQRSTIDSTVASTEKLVESLKKPGQNFFPSDEYNRLLHSTEDELKKLKALQEEITKQGGLANAEQMKSFNDSIATIKKNQESISNLSSSQKGSTPLQNIKTIERINKALEQNTRMSAEAKAELQGYIKELKNNPAANIKQIEAAWRNVVQAEKEAGRGGKSLLSAVGEKAFYGLAGQIASMVSLWDVINVIKQASSEVIQLNTDITDLAKVSEQSVKQIYSDFNSYADIAKEIGGTISDTISATTAWSKNGYSIPDSKELARVSLLYKNVGDDMTIDDANESLVSTLQGYKLAADDAEHIVDVFNEVEKIASYYSNVIALCV